MRKLIAIAAAAVLSLVLAGVALADFTQASNIVLTAAHAGKSTGIKADIHSTTSPGEAPKAAKLLVITFPAGTEVRPLPVKPCKLSDGQLTAGKSCTRQEPDRHRLGHRQRVPAPAADPRRREGLRGRAEQDGHGGRRRPPRSRRRSSSVRPRPGAKLTIPVPSPTVAGFQVVLVSLKLNVPRAGAARRR